MDGSSQRVLLSKDVVWPNGLAIDFKGKPNKINTELDTNIVNKKKDAQRQTKLLNWFQIGCLLYFNFI